MRAKAKFAYPVAGWSAAEDLNYHFKLSVDGAEHSGKTTETVKLSLQSKEFVAQIGDDPASPSMRFSLDESAADECTVHIDNVSKRVRFAFSDKDDARDTRLFLDDGDAHLIIDDHSYEPATAVSAGGDTQVRAAMDGAIVQVNVKAGQAVEAGEIVAVLEAMKMAHQLKAGVSGTIEDVLVQVGQQVKTRQVIVNIAVAE